MHVEREETFSTALNTKYRESTSTGLFVSDKNNHGSPDLEGLILSQTQKVRECENFSGGVSGMYFPLCCRKEQQKQKITPLAKKKKRNAFTTYQQLKAPKTKTTNTTAGLIGDTYVNTEDVHYTVISYRRYTKRQ